MNRLSRRRFLQLVGAAGAATALPAFPARAGSRSPGDGVWLAGDFHVHTVWSHDVWGGPGDLDPDGDTSKQELYTLGWKPGEQIRNAESRLLDFVAVTDHNRVDALHVPGYRSDRLVLVPGYEHSLPVGHAGVFVSDRSKLLTTVSDEGGLVPFLNRVHELDGVVVLNHPFDGSRWRGAFPDSHAVDAVEAWNSSWLQRGDLVPFAETNNHLAMQWWEEHFLKQGIRRGAVGGSDNHWRSTFMVQGVGQPTTWVYAANRSAGAILDGVRAGRTFVSAQPPAFLGPRVFLTATETWGDHHEAMVGGEVAPLGPIEVTVRVRNGAGLRLRLISSGRVVDDALLLSPLARRDRVIVLPQGGWLRAELYADPGYAMAAVTSAIWTNPTPAPAAHQRPVTVGRPLDYGPQLTLPEVSACC